ncbi:MAG: DNA topoisomerase IB [Propionicimonas sp.]|nr:DNA topoisomerase IB [Propionicimonas sp.]
MPRLRRVSPDTPGWSRRRRGRGFSYADQDGRRLTPAQVERVRALAIPPAWREVWICPDVLGHLQATGLDAAGRRQYLYHPAWRQRRDRQKFERVVAAAERLPQVRRRLARDLRREGMPLERAAALAVRLLDEGCFRIGNDVYADRHGSFGLTTLERRHVRRHGDGLRFRFTGKSGIEHVVDIGQPGLVRVVEEFRRAGRPGDRLLGYRTDAGWTALSAAAVNDYLARLFDGEFTAKDFRTWHATVIAAEQLAATGEAADSRASRRRAIRAAVARVAGYLGNTPAVARNSYIDPRVIDRFERGSTISLGAAALARGATARRTALEAAVRDLLGGEPAPPRR